MELHRAAQMLIERGAVVDPQPKLPGAAIVFCLAFLGDEPYRPDGWETTAQALLVHKIPYIREMAVKSLPKAISDKTVALLPALILDKQPDVQTAACHWVSSTGDVRLKKPVAEAFATAREDWAFRAASGALYALKEKETVLRTLVDRLDEEGMTARCVHDLVSATVADCSGGSFPSEKSFQEGEAKALKARWQKFLAEHGTDFRGDKALRVGDPRIAELFPHCTLSPRRSTIRIE